MEVQINGIQNDRDLQKQRLNWGANHQASSSCGNFSVGQRPSNYKGYG